MKGNGDIKLLCEWSIPYSDVQEEIILAHFLEDTNSDFVMVVTRIKPKSKYIPGLSKIYILKVAQKSINDEYESNDEEEDEEEEEEED